jgi:Na+/H+-dicarboxylate symporter
MEEEKIMLKNLPIQLIVAIFIAFFLGNILSLDVIRLFFTISCGLKEALMAILPFVIFSYIATAILSLEQRAPLLILGILSLVILSNAFMVLISCGIGVSLLPLITVGGSTVLCGIKHTVTPLLPINFPQILAPDQAMLIGMGFGLFFSFIKVPVVTAFTQSLRNCVTIFLHRAFIPLLPLYVFGFVLKMEYDGTLSILMRNCGQIFGLLCLLLMSYITFLYLLAGGFRLPRSLELIRTMLPAGITGFSTMSSAATMPVTLEATEKNMGDAQFTQLIIPTTVNIHMIGDALAIPILGIAVLMLSGAPLPTFENYLWFTVYFCIAKFSAAGIPGGTIIVMLPILQKYLGLSPEMASLITTIYIIQDPIFTSANVMGNGAFALLVRKLFPQK